VQTLEGELEFLQQAAMMASTPESSPSQLLETEVARLRDELEAALVGTEEAEGRAADSRSEVQALEGELESLQQAAMMASTPESSPSKIPKPSTSRGHSRQSSKTPLEPNELEVGMLKAELVAARASLREAEAGWQEAEAALATEEARSRTWQEEVLAKLKVTQDKEQTAKAAALEASFEAALQEERAQFEEAAEEAQATAYEAQDREQEVRQALEVLETKMVVLQEELAAAAAVKVKEENYKVEQYNMAGSPSDSLEDKKELESKIRKPSPTRRQHSVVVELEVEHIKGEVARLEDEIETLSARCVATEEALMQGQEEWNHEREGMDQDLLSLQESWTMREREWRDQEQELTQALSEAREPSTADGAAAIELTALHGDLKALSNENEELVEALEKARGKHAELMGDVEALREQIEHAAQETVGGDSAAVEALDALEAEVERSRGLMVEVERLQAEVAVTANELEVQAASWLREGEQLRSKVADKTRDVEQLSALYAELQQALTTAKDRFASERAEAQQELVVEKDRLASERALKLQAQQELQTLEVEMDSQRQQNQERLHAGSDSSFASRVNAGLGKSSSSLDSVDVDTIPEISASIDNSDHSLHRTSTAFLGPAPRPTGHQARDAAAAMLHAHRAFVGRSSDRLTTAELKQDGGNDGGLSPALSSDVIAAIFGKVYEQLVGDPRLPSPQPAQPIHFAPLTKTQYQQQQQEYHPHKQQQRELEKVSVRFPLFPFGPIWESPTKQKPRARGLQT
jgi:hypothetical protein